MATRIIVGHVLEVLAGMAKRSAHMVWTSVPYWGLRSYQTEPQVWDGAPDCDHDWGSALPPRPGRGNKPGDYSTSSLTNPERQDEMTRPSTAGNFCSHCNAWRGEHGLEPTLGLWLQHEVEIFRAVRRVLRDDGTVWINCGDAYASSANGTPAAQIKNDDRTFRDKPFNTAGPIYDPNAEKGDRRGEGKQSTHAGMKDNTGRIRAAGAFKPKDRIMMPARLAIALHDDGWFLRDEIIWAKKNPMPSSVRDRTTPAHEMIYMLTKKPRYFFDRHAISDPAINSGRVISYSDGQKNIGRDERFYPGADGRDVTVAQTRNKRSVWHLALEPFPGAHFATAPSGIVRPCILAGTSAKGVCPHCGAPWVREIDVEYEEAGQGNNNMARKGVPFEGTGSARPYKTRKLRHTQTIGWSASCKCPNNKPVPATVLDPFGGSGTTAIVADELGRDCILIELNPEYADAARARLRGALARVESNLAEQQPGEGLPLFAVDHG